ncbi:DUF6392 family protein [Photorhabdus sp. RM96S]|uniref:DUF6392 family protein n=1 Tax=Photorhabdus TaxID=29487 RepID=UPI0036DD632D
MSREWIHKQFGKPEKSLPPRKRLKKDIGWTELYPSSFKLPLCWLHSLTPVT